VETSISREYYSFSGVQNGKHRKTLEHVGSFKVWEDVSLQRLRVGFRRGTQRSPLNHTQGLVIVRVLSWILNSYINFSCNASSFVIIYSAVYVDHRWAILWQTDLSLPLTDYLSFGQPLWFDSALVNKLVLCAWLLSGALEAWRLRWRATCISIAWIAETSSMSPECSYEVRILFRSRCT